MKNQITSEILKKFKVDFKDLNHLCEHFDVKSLSLFGSALTSHFVRGKSDLDFMVEFNSITFDQYFGFLEGLKKLFRYENIDLITIGSLKNPIIKQDIESKKATLYAA